ncbi:MAG: O-antigen ligase family protein [Planctomycetota bacterium]
MNTKLGILCDKFIEACWLAALILSPVYMDIYTHRMFEPDKACVIRSLAILMIVFYIVKVFESKSADKIFPATNQKSSSFKDVKSLEDKTSFFSMNFIFIPFLLFVIAYIVSVIFSAVPYNSVWGGFDRLQGLYTNASFWVIFILAAINIRSKEQIKRIISTIIFTSVPIVAYSFIQRLRLDPVPWQAMDPSIRVSATMGNPIFLAAYLIIAIPLTISRFVRCFVDKKLVVFPDIFSIVFYGLMVVLQVITVFLSQSRGPILGMFASIFAFVFIYAWAYRKKYLFMLIAVLFVIGIIFLALFNLPHLMPDKKLSPKIEPLWQKTFGRLMEVPYVRQLGRVVETDPGSSGRTRIILWNGIWKLINDKDEPYRFFIGYGPESLSTVYYKNYTMELAKLEGVNVHADRSHNGYLDVWVMNGIFGLVSYLFLLVCIMYMALKTIKPKKENGQVDNDGNYLTLMMIGLITAITAHLVEIFVGIAIVSTFTHFWIITAAIYATYKLKLLSRSGANEQLSKEESNQKLNKNISHQESSKPNTSEANKILNWRFYLFVGYIILTIVIAFILFKYSWPESKMLTPDIKDSRNTLLMTFCGWLLFGFLVGVAVWPSFVFWTYACQTLIMEVVMVKKYWPDDTTNTDTLIIYSWLWILAGIIIGAFSLRREEKPVKFCYFSNVLIGSVMLITVSFVIIKSNLFPLRADGFYKFCFSYDISAEEFLRTGKMEESYRTRVACIRNFQNALKYAPDERAYLNGSGRNFLELSKLASQRNQNVANRLLAPPSIKEIVEFNLERFNNFSSRDFFLCSASCIQKAYELDLNNFERIIALIRIYRYWGELDKDTTKFTKGLELCNEAKRTSPLNTKVTDEIRELQRLIGMYSPK